MPPPKPGIRRSKSAIARGPTPLDSAFFFEDFGILSQLSGEFVSETDKMLVESLIFLASFVVYGIGIDFARVSSKPKHSKPCQAKSHRLPTEFW